jgi:hypothetical protein
MYLCSEFSGMGGERPQGKPQPKYSKGYPEVSAPAPRGILSDNLDEASLRRLRQHYGPPTYRF